MSGLEKAKAFVSELAFENPRPVEKWFENRNFDPSFGRTELRYAAGRRWIELDMSDDENWRFRFTAIGRDYLDAVENKSG